MRTRTFAGAVVLATSSMVTFPASASEPPDVEDIDAATPIEVVDAATPIEVADGAALAPPPPPAPAPAPAAPVVEVAPMPRQIIRIDATLTLDKAGKPVLGLFNGRNSDPNSIFPGASVVEFVPGEWKVTFPALNGYECRSVRVLVRARAATARVGPDAKDNPVVTFTAATIVNGAWTSVDIELRCTPPTPRR
jgi:hypothetical protein